TSMPPEIRTRATLRSAEFGFFGVVVYTRVHTPRRCGAATFFLRPLPDLRPGVDSFLDFGVRPLRTSWLVVGMRRVMVAKSAPRLGCDRLQRLRRRGELQALVLRHRLVGHLARSDVEAEQEARV